MGKVVVFSVLTYSFINVKGNHDLRPEVSLFAWLGMAINEKAFVAVANAMVLNSLLFLGEIAQIFTVSARSILARACER